MFSKEIMDLLEYSKVEDNLEDYAKRNRQLFKLLKQQTSFLDVKALARCRLWHVEHNTTKPPSCKICDNPVKWHNLSRKYQTYCSLACSHKDSDRLEKIKHTNIKKYGTEWNIASKSSRSKRLNTCLGKYGTEHVTQNQDVKEKIKSTNIKKYGTEWNIASKSSRSKRKQTNLEKYDTEHPAQHSECKSKMIETNLERYGVKFVSQNSEIRQKQINTLIQKYGVDNVRKSDIIKERIRQTWIKKYGFSHPMKSDDIKIKTLETNKINHNGVHNSQQHMANILPLLEDYDWLYMQYITLGKTSIQIANELNNNQETICRYIHKHEIEIRQLYWYSISQIQWLESIMEEEGIFIQHALNGGEYRIPGSRYRADGYCAATNTIYEFHGDYWHGNPKIYKPDDYNGSTNCTMGELYNKTIEKEKKIRDLGYNLIIQWES